ncbi:MAG: hypothetical protein QOD69_2813 [Solirubrobacteraceae bacterium]|nr:hypothetical protein [Solirubrobacteraceae bacterium]
MSINLRIRPAIAVAALSCGGWAAVALAQSAPPGAPPPATTATTPATTTTPTTTQTAPNDASSTTEPVLSSACLKGTGSRGWCGDGGPGTKAKLASPHDIALIGRKAYLIADFQNNLVRRVSSAGIITTVAGIGIAGHQGDDGPAKLARLDGPAGVSRYPGGGFLVSEAGGNTVRRVKPDGTIVTVAGTGTAGSGGDGGPATAAQLRNPRNVVALADGGYLIADTGNDRIRMVTANGTIRTVAGRGVTGYAGDGGPATAARLNSPTGVSPTATGGFLVADRGNGVIRLVGPDGIISTVAGGTQPAAAGQTMQVRLRLPTGVAALPDGGFLVADAGRVRRMHPDGQTTTVAGNGRIGHTGDRGPATRLRLAYVAAVAPMPDGAFLLADEANDRVRRVSPVGEMRTKVGTGTPAPPEDQDSPPPARAQGARAASAGRVAAVASGAPRCRVDKYIPTFQTLSIMPVGKAALPVRRNRPIRFTYATYVPPRPAGRPPNIVIAVMLGSKAVTKRNETPRNGSHVVVLRKRLKAGRTYQLVINGVHVQAGHVAKRCDTRHMRVR